MNYPLPSKIIFYVMLIYYKLTSALECRNYRVKVFLNQFNFLFATLFGLDKLKSNNTQLITLNTIFGTYIIRNISSDITIASPSFERQDIEELLDRIHKSLINNTRVVFIDAGACFGKYTVLVGGRFRSYKNRLSILAFEPDPENYKLLEINIRINKLHNVQAFQTALSNKRAMKPFYYFEPMKQIVSFKTSKRIIIPTTRLDSYQNNVKSGHDCELFIKLDVEGHENEVLQGAGRMFRRYKNTIVLAEDSMPGHNNPMNYLSSHGSFITKISSYNSFWQL